MGGRRRGRAVLAAAVLLAASTAGAGSSGARSAGGPPRRLDRPYRGEAAVSALGDSLPEVAAGHGMTAGRLRQLFRTDGSLWVDETERLFFLDPGPPVPVEPAAVGGAPAAAGSSGGSDVFGLHSRPGAERVVYLDLDGHTTTGTAWNDNSALGTGPTVLSTPYDSDGQQGTFSPAELAVIEDLWTRVAEDFAPFDVDVTTADPGVAAVERTSVADGAYGTRVVIAGTNPISGACGCGGAAYVGAFDEANFHSYYQPAFVFQAGLGGASATAKLLAEAASHEAGHTLGLSHDGTSSSAYHEGHGAWAPIMGVGYYRPITQWSRGEYAGANNAEDDLVRMSSHGAPPLPDDHGDTIETATPINGSASGRIETASDADVFRFTASGAPQADLRVSPASAGANLDVRLSLFDPGGTLLASSDPPSGAATAEVATGLAASLTSPLAAGTYYLRVEGVGAGDPATTGYSDYGSLGAYTLTAVDQPCVSGVDVVAWWKGEDSLQGEVGPALSGPAAFADAVVGRGLWLAGPGVVAASGVATVTDAVTVEGWVRPADTAQAQVLASRWRFAGGDDERSYALYLADHALVWATDEATTRRPLEVRVQAPQLFDGGFHHVAGTWDRADVTLYVDGVAVASSRSQGGTLNPASSIPVRVGSADRGGLFLSGIVDELTIYRRALPAEQVAAIHAIGPTGKCLT